MNSLSPEGAHSPDSGDILTPLLILQDLLSRTETITTSSKCITSQITKQVFGSFKIY